MGKHAKLKEKHKWSNEKLHLENASKIARDLFHRPRGHGIQEETIKNARKKLGNHQWPVLCRVKLWRKIVGVVDSTKLIQNLGAFWKLMNLRDCVWQNHCQIIMKAILQEKETIHHSTTIWFANLFPCFSFKKIQQHKQRWSKEWENWRKFRRGTWQVKSKKQVIDWSKDVGRYNSFCIINGHMSSEKCWIGDKAPQIQRSSCTPWWYCKRRFSVLRSIHWTRIISISKMTAAKIPGHHLQIAGLPWTSSWRSIGVYPSKKMEDAHKLLKIPKSECPDIWIRLPRHKWPKSWSSME